MQDGSSRVSQSITWVEEFTHVHTSPQPLQKRWAVSNNRLWHRVQYLHKNGSTYIQTRTNSRKCAHRLSSDYATSVMMSVIWFHFLQMWWEARLIKCWEAIKPNKPALALSSVCVRASAGARWVAEPYKRQSLCSGVDGMLEQTRIAGKLLRQDITVMRKPCENAVLERCQAL